jgi:hypothetical protein
VILHSIAKLLEFASFAVLYFLCGLDLTVSCNFAWPSRLKTCADFLSSVNIWLRFIFCSSY